MTDWLLFLWDNTVKKRMLFSPEVTSCGYIDASLSPELVGDPTNRKQIHYISVH